jgi:hypothetical protein
MAHVGTICDTLYLMRKLIPILLVCLAGCRLQYTGQEDWNYFASCNYPSPTQSENVNQWLMDLESWTVANVVWTTDTEQYGTADYWASPRETLNSMKGDCDDQAILFGYIAHVKAGLSVHFIVQEIENVGLHMTVVVDDPPTYWLGYNPAQGKKLLSYNYGEAMWIAENTHGSYTGGRSIE